MKEGEEEKTKTYSALVWTDKAIQKEDIAFLDDIKVSVALCFFVFFFPGVLGVLGEILYTCTHGHTSFLWLVGLFDRGSFCYMTFISPFPFPLLTVRWPVTSYCVIADQIINSREWEGEIWHPRLFLYLRLFCLSERNGDCFCKL